MQVIHILGINGSIRNNSSSRVMINEVISNLPVNVKFELFERLAEIPAFDGSEPDPESVAHFKSQVQMADAIVICTPEYAFGVPGALKNAIDWTVGSGDFMNKPVALITASSHGEKCHEALQHIFTAIAAKLDPATTLLISSIRNKVIEGRIKDSSTVELVKSLSRHLINRIENL